jgi:DNA-binding CsgD family transcriptional regulator/PAS domain-containing protein
MYTIVPNDLLDAIYAATAGEISWLEVAERLQRATAANTGALLWCEAQGMELLGAPGIPDDAMHRYAQHFHTRDPWAATGHAIVVKSRQLGRLRGAVLGPEIVPEQVLRRSEYYNDFARGIGNFHLLGAMQPVNGSATLLVGLHRAQHAEPFSEAERRTLDATLPHLRRGLDLWDQLRRHAAGTAPAALDALQTGVVVVDAGLRVLHTNAAAEQLAQEGGFRLVRNGGVTHLAAEHSADQAGLSARVVAVAAQGQAGGGLLLRRAKGGMLAATVMRLPPRGARGLAVAAGSTALLLLRDLSRPALPDATLLCDLFGTTPAEAQVARAAAAGMTAEAIAAARQTSVNTVRTQLRIAMTKTQAASLRELAALLATLQG